MNIYTSEQAKIFGHVFEILLDNWPILAFVAVFMVTLTLFVDYKTKQYKAVDTVDDS